MSAAGIKKALLAGAFFVFWATVAAGACEPVARVFDGDSFLLADQREVRLLGINTPELGRAGAPDQPLARAARERLVALLADRCVTLVFDREREDRYGRLLASVRLEDKTRVEAVLLREGLAWTVAVPPNLAHLKRHQAAEAQARARGLGVWGEPAYAPAAAERLTPQDTGFRIVQGTVRRVAQGAYGAFLDLAPGVTLRIAREDLRYFHLKPERFLGRRVVARGWVAEYKGGLRLRLTHPAMLTFAE